MSDKVSRFHVTSEGDASVGVDQRTAEITFDREVSPDEIQEVKAALQRCFEDIWNDDVEVLTQNEVDEDALEGAEPQN